MNMDHKLYTCAVFIDLAKAFDTVDHALLFKNLMFMEYEAVCTIGLSLSICLIERKLPVLTIAYQKR